MQLTTERAIMDDLLFPEDPRWRGDRLFFSDMLDRKVFSLDERGPSEVLAMLEHNPSGLGFLPNGGLVIVSMDDARLLLRHSDGEVTQYADLSGLAPALNDMVIDRSGRAYVVQFTPEPAPLVIVEPDGTARCTDELLQFGNGIRLSDDERTLIVAESGAGRLSIFDVVAGGDLSNQRTVALPADHYPDGIALDEAGGLWSACLWNGVIRTTLDGRVTHRVTLPDGMQAYA